MTDKKAKATNPVKAHLPFADLTGLTPEQSAFQRTHPAVRQQILDGMRGGNYIRWQQFARIHQIQSHVDFIRGAQGRRSPYAHPRAQQPWGNPAQNAAGTTMTMPRVSGNAVHLSISPTGVACMAGGKSPKTTTKTEEVTCGSCKRTINHGLKDGTVERAAWGGPGKWRRLAGFADMAGRRLTWDEIGERHPGIYGDPEVHGDEADGADGEGIGWAAAHLAFERPGHEEPDEGSWDLDFHLQSVPVSQIDFARHGSGDSRVNSARRWYRDSPDEVVPPVLVHRHGVYQVADGHHRGEAADLEGLEHIPAYVAQSPHEDEPFSDGARGPYHGAEPVSKTGKVSTDSLDNTSYQVVASAEDDNPMAGLEALLEGLPVAGSPVQHTVPTKDDIHTLAEMGFGRHGGDEPYWLRREGDKDYMIAPQIDGYWEQSVGPHDHWAEGSEDEVYPTAHTTFAEALEHMQVPPRAEPRRPGRMVDFDLGQVDPHLQSTSAAEGLTVKDYEGQEGNNSHITRNEQGMIPVDWVRNMLGARGETPGTHRNAEGEEWEQFKAHVAAGTPGYSSPVFIVVEHGKEPLLYEGNHRRDAYIENGATHLPAEIRYFGHAERQGTVGDRAMRRTAAVADESGLKAAGIAVIAMDTGRLLMLQRALNPIHCPCGLGVTWDESNGYQHEDGSVSHDGEFYGQSVSDLLDQGHPERLLCPCCLGQGDNLQGSECASCDGSGTDQEEPSCDPPCREVDGLDKTAALEFDPNEGVWEFPGGKIDPGEQPRAAATREFREEVGQDLPPGVFVGAWLSPGGLVVAARRAKDRGLATVAMQPGDQTYGFQQGGTHTAPSDRSYASPLHDVEDMMPGFYDGHHTDYSHGNDGDAESISKILAAHNQPEKKIRIYRAVPHGISKIYGRQELQQMFPDHDPDHLGEWVGISKDYALEHARSQQCPKCGGNLQVITGVAKAKDLLNEGYPTEWGYVGDATLEHSGSNRIYKTKCPAPRRVPKTSEQLEAEYDAIKHLGLEAVQQWEQENEADRMLRLRPRRRRRTAEYHAQPTEPDLTWLNTIGKRLGWERVTHFGEGSHFYERKMPDGSMHMLTWSPLSGTWGGEAVDQTGRSFFGSQVPSYPTAMAGHAGLNSVERAGKKERTREDARADQTEEARWDYDPKKSFEDWATPQSAAHDLMQRLNAAGAEPPEDHTLALIASGWKPKQEGEHLLAPDFTKVSPSTGLYHNVSWNASTGKWMYDATVPHWDNVEFRETRRSVNPDDPRRTLGGRGNIPLDDPDAVNKEHRRLERSYLLGSQHGEPGIAHMFSDRSGSPYDEEFPDIAAVTQRSEPAFERLREGDPLKGTHPQPDVQYRDFNIPKPGEKWVEGLHDMSLLDEPPHMNPWGGLEKLNAVDPEYQAEFHKWLDREVGYSPEDFAAMPINEQRELADGFGHYVGDEHRHDARYHLELGGHREQKVRTGRPGTTVRVLRVEKPDGSGPFEYGKGINPRPFEGSPPMDLDMYQLMNPYHEDDPDKAGMRQRMPDADKIPTRYVRGRVFGFLPQHNIGDYFTPRMLQGMHDRGYVMSEYDVPGESLVLGRTQAAWKPEDAKLVSRNPLVKLNATFQYNRFVPDPEGMKPGEYVEHQEELAGPFYHGSRSRRLKPGDHLTIGRKTNSWGDEGERSQWVHITSDAGAAGTYAREAGGHVYEVEPTGPIHQGYSGGEYKTKHPVRVVRRLGMEHEAAAKPPVYKGFIYLVEREKDLDLKAEREVINPDDPDGDVTEQLAWWDIEHAKKNPALRPECKKGTPWAELELWADKSVRTNKEVKEAFAKLAGAGKCSYCKSTATKEIKHSEGMGLISVCDKHLAKGKEDAENCTPDGTRDPSNIDWVHEAASREPEWLKDHNPESVLKDVPKEPVRPGDPAAGEPWWVYEPVKKEAMPLTQDVPRVNHTIRSGQPSDSSSTYSEARVDDVTLPSGDWIRKLPQHRHLTDEEYSRDPSDALYFLDQAGSEADMEEFASKFGRAISDPAGQSIAPEAVRGQKATDLSPSVYVRKHHDLIDMKGDPASDQHVGTQRGKTIGLFHAVLGEGDHVDHQNMGMSGGQPVSIDHAKASLPLLSDAITQGNRDDVGQMVWHHEFGLSPYERHFLGKSAAGNTAPRKSNPLGPGDAERVHGALESMRPWARERGREEWVDAAQHRVKLLGKRAGGTESMFPYQMPHEAPGMEHAAATRPPSRPAFARLHEVIAKGRPEFEVRTDEDIPMSQHDAIVDNDRPEYHEERDYKPGSPKLYAILTGNKHTFLAPVVHRETGEVGWLRGGDYSPPEKWTFYAEHQLSNAIKGYRPNYVVPDPNAPTPADQRYVRQRATGKPLRAEGDPELDEQGHQVAHRRPDPFEEVARQRGGWSTTGSTEHPWWVYS